MSCRRLCAPRAVPSSSLSVLLDLGLQRRSSNVLGGLVCRWQWGILWRGRAGSRPHLLWRHVGPVRVAGAPEIVVVADEAQWTRRPTSAHPILWHTRRLHFAPPLHRVAMRARSGDRAHTARSGACRVPPAQAIPAKALEVNGLLARVVAVLAQDRISEALTEHRQGKGGDPSSSRIRDFAEARGAPPSISLRPGNCSGA
jgi:hypothetical protein